MSSHYCQIREVHLSPDPNLSGLFLIPSDCVHLSGHGKDFCASRAYVGLLEPELSRRCGKSERCPAPAQWAKPPFSQWLLRQSTTYRPTWTAEHVPTHGRQPTKPDLIDHHGGPKSLNRLTPYYQSNCILSGSRARLSIPLIVLTLGSSRASRAKTSSNCEGQQGDTIIHHC